jgi:hypothetical protein
VVARLTDGKQIEETAMAANDHEQAIRNSAYPLWEADGRPEGRHESHRHRAARELGLAGPLGQAVGTTIAQNAKGRLRKPAAWTTELP